jgi:hypothetical protein
MGFTGALTVGLFGFVTFGVADFVVVVVVVLVAFFSG